MSNDPSSIEWLDTGLFDRGHAEYRPHQRCAGIQFFELMLGPHLGKKFLTTISARIVMIYDTGAAPLNARGRAAGGSGVSRT